MSEKNISRALKRESLTDKQIFALLKRTLPIEEAIKSLGKRFYAQYHFTSTLNTLVLEVAESRDLEIPEPITFKHDLDASHADLLLHSISRNALPRHDGELKVVREKTAPAILERMMVITDNGKHLGSYYEATLRDIGVTVPALIELKKNK
ncbi:hypothetical protein [Vibrio sp. D431a]|uniref:hypothetical protein n=1 Tax=Vibrio sp. D431a TaxID=2837388 RepID=UPI00255238F9|nr:hypothetical protein [Vibrio sp. D431a]MDK9789850.1 hypothetical protein [Vibrio sp. D431a]